MRPDRAVVKKALVDAGGDKTRAAAILGCSRQTLYTWIYQLGLERLAGISLDRRLELDTARRKDTKVPRAEKTIKPSVYSTQQSTPNLRVVTAQAPAEVPLQATVKLPESLWKLVKIEAIREGCTVSEFVRRTLEATLGARTARRQEGERPR